jgi:hypothetical protein
VNVATVDDVNFVTDEEDKIENLVLAPTFATEIDTGSNEVYEKSSPVNFEDILVSHRIYSVSLLVH